ncbi:hypothetical protein LBMAG42_39140 [Deltaproteobacteria bacterium]|nr:hypothetical protein LBMAG42_39140 [Deltaproteobacteria bacterium]
MSIAIYLLLAQTAWATEPMPTVPPDPKLVHWSEVQMKVRGMPKYPKAAKAAGIEGTCTMQLCVDAKGKLTNVTPRSCPEVFVESATAASWKSKFYPVKSKDEPTPVCFDLRYQYKLAGSSSPASPPEPPNPAPANDTAGTPAPAAPAAPPAPGTQGPVEPAPPPP